MNKQEKLLNAIDQIDEKYLAEAINYKRKPVKKKWWIAVAASAAAFVVIFSMGCVTHPAFAEKVPLVGKVFADLGDSLGYGGDYEKYAETVKNKKTGEKKLAKTVNGVTVTLDETYCNDYELFISLTIDSEKAFPVEKIQTYDDGTYLYTRDTTVNTDFKELGTGMHEIDGKFVNDHKYEGVIRLDLNTPVRSVRRNGKIYLVDSSGHETEVDGDQSAYEKQSVPENFSVDMSIGKIMADIGTSGDTYEADGPWDFSFDVTVNNDKTEKKELTADTADGMTITVIKTPFDISYRADTLEHSYDYEVLFTDRDGKLLTYKGGLSRDVAVNGSDISELGVFVMKRDTYEKEEDRILKAKENASELLKSVSIWSQKLN